MQIDSVDVAELVVFALGTQKEKRFSEVAGGEANLEY